MLAKHFIGKRKPSNHGYDLISAACLAGDETEVPLTADCSDVDCTACLKHGIVLHSKAVLGLPGGKESIRFSTEYENLATLSAEEIARLDHYGYWFWVKSMSMVRLWLDIPDSCEALEQDEAKWVEVRDLLSRGEGRRARTLGNTIAAVRSPASTSFDSEHHSCIPDVNKFRKMGYRVPIFGSNSPAPRRGESESDVLRNTDILVGIEAAGVSDSSFGKAHSHRMKLPAAFILSPADSFVLAAVAIDVLKSFRDVRYFVREMEDEQIRLPTAVLSNIYARLSVFFPTHRVIVVGHKEEENMNAATTESVRKVLCDFEWFDPSVFLQAVALVDEARNRRNLVHSAANQMTADEERARTYRKTASEHVTPRSIMTITNGELVLLSFRNAYRIFSSNDQDFTLSSLLLLPKQERHE